MLKNYITTALRNLWRNKFFSFINIFGLSLGIACCMLIFLYAKDEMRFDRFHKKGENIYHLTLDWIDAKGEVFYSPCTGMMPGPAFKKGVPEIEEYVRIQSAFCDIKKDGDILSQQALWVDENFLSVFTFPVLHGNSVNPLKELNSVVITEALAEKLFGKPDVVGQTLIMNTFEQFDPFIISAVIRNPPSNSSIKASVLLPISFNQKQNNDQQWMNSFLNTFVLLKPNSDLNKVAEKCNSIYLAEAGPQIKEMKEKYGIDEKTIYGLQPFFAMHLNTNYPATNGLENASNPAYSYILIGIAGFILIIACINFVNLTIARSLKRAKEIGIRKVVGGLRKQLIAQFLGESFVLSLFSFAVAVLLVVLVLPFFNSVSNKALAFSYLLDWKLVAGYCSLFLLTGLLAGFYPALVLSRFNPVQTLYGKLKLSHKNYLSQGLIILQFSLATFFIIGTVAIYSQFNFMMHYDLGYDKTNVLQVRTGKMNNIRLQTIKNELLKEPSILMVTAREEGERHTLAHINGKVQQEFKMDKIDEDHFKLFRIPVVTGRNFSKDYPADSTLSVIVNEKFVKVAGWKNPIGEIIDFDYKNKKYTVIGVVKDFQTGPLTQELKPQVFSLDPESPYNKLQIKVDPLGKTAALAHIQKVIKENFPSIPFQYSFLEDQLSNQYEDEKKWKQIISFSSLLTIFISCIGLLGLAVLSSENRAKEISIRKVLGATSSTLVKNLSLDFLKLVIVAAVISVPAAWWTLNKWLQAYAYRVDLNPAIFIIPVLAVVCIALLTVSYQAIKSAMSNPVKSLRTE